MLACIPRPVEPVQIYVAEQGGGRTPLGGSGHRPPHHPLGHHPGAEHDATQPQHGLVTDPFLDRLSQPVFRDRLDTVGDIRLDHPPPTTPRLIHEDSQGIVRRTSRAEPDTARPTVRLEDRFKHTLHHGPHDPITDRRDRQRSRLPRLSRLRDHHVPSRQRPITSLAQLRLNLGQEPLYTVFLDRTHGELLDTQRAVIATHRNPPTPQDIPAQGLIPQCVEPSPGTGLAPPGTACVQGTDLIRRGRVAAAPL
jgi:hypothetical protein